MVEHARTFGQKKDRYEINALVRYQCMEGFVQRHVPTVRCLPTGHWEEPRITCTDREHHPLPPAQGTALQPTCPHLSPEHLGVINPHRWHHLQTRPPVTATPHPTAYSQEGESRQPAFLFNTHLKPLSPSRFKSNQNQQAEKQTSGCLHWPRFLQGRQPAEKGPHREARLARSLPSAHRDHSLSLPLASSYKRRLQKRSSRPPWRSRPSTAH